MLFKEGRHAAAGVEGTTEQDHVSIEIIVPFSSWRLLSAIYYKSSHYPHLRPNSGCFSIDPGGVQRVNRSCATGHIPPL